MNPNRCPACNATVDADAIFCRECGHRVDSGDGSATPAHGDVRGAGDTGDESGRTSGVRGTRSQEAVSTGEQEAEPTPGTVDPPADTDPGTGRDADDTTGANDIDASSGVGRTEAPDPGTPAPEVDEPSRRHRFSTRHVLATIVGATVVAAVAFLASWQVAPDLLAGMVPAPTPVVVFALAWVVAAIGCGLQRSAGESLGAGLYVVAGVLALLPLALYLPALLGDETVTIGGFDVLIWALIVPPVAVVTAVVAHLFRWRGAAARKRSVRPSGNRGLG